MLLSVETLKKSELNCLLLISFCSLFMFFVQVGGSSTIHEIYTCTRALLLLSRTLFG